MRFFIPWSQREGWRQRHPLLSLLRSERLQSRLGEIVTNQRIRTGERCSISACAWSTARGTICGRKIISVSCRIMPAVGSVYASHHTNGVPPRRYGHPLPGCWRAPPGPLHPTKRLTVALCSLKGHIALRRGSHNCHVLEGKAVAEAVTLLAGKAVGNVSRNICHVGCSAGPFAGLTLNNLLQLHVST